MSGSSSQPEPIKVGSIKFEKTTPAKNMSTREEKDRVTVKEIREQMERTMDAHIDTMSKLIRQRDINRAAESFETIKERVEELNKLDQWAGLPILHKKGL